MRGRRLPALGVAAALVAPPALAVIGAAPAPSSSAAAPADDAESSSATCKETFLAGSERPKVTESFPDRGKSGYALVLDVTVLHGKGESILPSGIGSETGGEAARALESAGFFLPSGKGASAPKLETKVDGNQGRSHLTISVVALPKKPGRTELTLPPLPIAMARASGEVRTLCTAPHTVILEDPIANTPDPKPKYNPKPIRQLEEWTAAKYATFGAAGAAVIAVLLAWLLAFLRRRPKPVPPPPPPRPPWEVALEELFDVRVAQLVEQGRFAEHFDRVSDAVRRYLGSRYGFDGLETTTREAMHALRKVTPFIGSLQDIDSFLQNADLVKFAKLTPTEPECHSALGSAEDIVRRTMPLPADPFANLPKREVPVAPAAPGEYTPPPDERGGRP
ncbi:MAG TPA: hypothetical protein VH062_29735 [Polyangiaceae bacterium]|jgi:hypothetical protein|nr:hypothetical protein [Polyangiaceae bacterium]